MWSKASTESYIPLLPSPQRKCPKSSSSKQPGQQAVLCVSGFEAPQLRLYLCRHQGFLSLSLSEAECLLCLSWLLKKEKWWEWCCSHDTFKMVVLNMYFHIFLYWRKCTISLFKYDGSHSITALSHAANNRRLNTRYWGHFSCIQSLINTSCR